MSPAVLHPPFNIVRVSHVEYTVADLSRSRAFWVDALGFIVTEQAADALYLRGLEERHHHSVVLRLGPVPTVRALGFKVFEEEGLDRAASWFRAPILMAGRSIGPFQSRSPIRMARSPAIHRLRRSPMKHSP